METHKPTEEAPKRRRCKNCGKLFWPRAPHQECCCDHCRKEFWKFRGPAWPKIEDAIKKEVRRQVSAIRRELALLVDKLPPLEVHEDE
jgi:uncharacterized protein with PIN domain